MRRVRRRLGAVMVEAGLVFVPFLILSLGFLEYLWYEQIQATLAEASQRALIFAAEDHHELAKQGGGSFFQSLDPLRDGAKEKAVQLLQSMNYSDEFISSLEVDIDFINNLAKKGSRYYFRGIPQNKGRRLVAATVSLPYERAMLFGNLSAKLLGLFASGISPERMSITTFMWKQWKEEA